MEGVDYSDPDSHFDSRDTVHVYIQSIAGECLEVDVGPRRQISHVKQFIAESWKIPEEFQRLVLDTGTLRDQDVLAAHRRADDYLWLL